MLLYLCNIKLLMFNEWETYGLLYHAKSKLIQTTNYSLTKYNLYLVKFTETGFLLSIKIWKYCSQLGWYCIKLAAVNNHRLEVKGGL